MKDFYLILMILIILIMITNQIVKMFNKIVGLKIGVILMIIIGINKKKRKKNNQNKKKNKKIQDSNLIYLEHLVNQMINKQQKIPSKIII